MQLEILSVYKPEIPHLKEIRAKFWPVWIRKGKKWFYSRFSLHFKSQIVGINIESVFLINWKLKFYLRIPYLGILGQYIGPVWVKNGKKGCFHTRNFTPNLVFPQSSFHTN